VVARLTVSGVVWPWKAAVTRSAALRNWSKEVNRASRAEISIHFPPKALVCCAGAWPAQKDVGELK